MKSAYGIQNTIQFENPEYPFGHPIRQAADGVAMKVTLEGKQLPVFHIEYPVTQ